MADKYEVVMKGANNAKNQPYKVGDVLELKEVPSFLVGKVRKVSDLVKPVDNSEKLEALKAENAALKAELESLKKAPELDLEAATPKPAAKK